ncbi:MAG: glycosyltransferase family 39 protein [Candidatus Omnitrophica bacterium]|nr:glycosyltransferase family 39 protein [Candidatus Omnitrophota bacterium]
MRKQKIGITNILILIGLIGLLPILKVFLIPGCMAFDATDDANHTFVNLFIARQSLSAGEIPLINFWNNFGTPILGDVLTYPWALHAQTYWFFPADVAMAINRFLLAGATTLLLILYFRRSMSNLAAGVGAVLAFLTPGFFWHFAHHHYQAALFCFTLILLTQDHFIKKPRFLTWFFLAISFVFTFFNTSIHAVCLMIPFLLGQQIFSPQGRRLKSVSGLFAALIIGILCALPDLIHFVHLISQSMRVQGNYGMPAHLTVAKRFSIPMVGLALSGAFLLWQKDPQGKRESLKILILGFMPILIVFFLFHFQAIWQAIPLVKSTDISRLWWFSNVFLMQGVGQCIDRLNQKNKWTAGLILYSYLLLLLELCFRVFLKHSFFYHHMYLIFFTAFILICIAAVHLSKNFAQNKKLPSYLMNPNHRRIIAALIIILQMIVISTRILEVQNLSVCRAGCYFTEKGGDLFTPRSFLKYIPPKTRIAVDDLSEQGRDLKINRDLIFGSSGRSVVLNKDFSEYLLKENLITPDNAQFAYHFSPPWRIEPLAELGIRFIMQKGINPTLTKQGWRLLATENEWALYEHPQQPSLVYLQNQRGERRYLALSQFNIHGNTIRIQLPEIQEAQELVATFVHLSGWRGYVDGKERSLYHQTNQLIRLEITPHDHEILLKYAFTTHSE